MSSRHSFLSTTGLIRSPSSVSLVPSVHASSSGTMPGKSPRFHRRTPNDSNLVQSTGPRRPFGNNGIIPLNPVFIVGTAIVISLLFIGALSFAFIGGEDELVFKDLLNDIAEHSPGIVLVGDNVDVDIDEPAVTVRWSILACGKNFTLPGSEGTHGSATCGIPSMPLYIYVDSEENPTATYDPTQLPFTADSGERLRIQDLHQFDSDHILDVHEARLYPFDTYRLTSTLRAVESGTNESIPIIRLLTITDTSNFVIMSTDSASYIVSSSAESIQEPSRNLEMVIRRPGEARTFALMLFGVSWMMAHSTVAYVALAWKSDDTERVAKYLAYSVTTMVVIPKIRDSMPDAPGLDGVLIDQIGFFSQMLVTGIAVVTLLATLAKRELARFEEKEPVQEFVKERPAPISTGLHKLRMGSSTSVDFRHIRNLSRTFSGRVPPSPIPEQTDRNSPFSEYNGFPNIQASSSRLASQRLGVSTPNSSSRSLHERPVGTLYSEWV